MDSEINEIKREIEACNRYLNEPWVSPEERKDRGGIVFSTKEGKERYFREGLQEYEAELSKLNERKLKLLRKCNRISSDISVELKQHPHIGILKAMLYEIYKKDNLSLCHGIPFITNKTVFQKFNELLEKSGDLLVSTHEFKRYLEVIGFDRRTYKKIPVHSSSQDALKVVNCLIFTEDIVKTITPQ